MRREDWLGEEFFHLAVRIFNSVGSRSFILSNVRFCQSSGRVSKFSRVIFDRSSVIRSSTISAADLMEPPGGVWYL